MHRTVLLVCVFLSVVNYSYGVLSVFDDHGYLTLTAGASVDEIIGATVWQNLGYRGSTVAVANVEAGLAADTHSAIAPALAYGNHYIFTPGSELTAAEDFYDLHATQTSTVMAGRSSNPAHNGIASSAVLHSGAIATKFGSNGSFSVSNESVYNAYSEYFEGGNGVSVINSSWGGSTYRNSLSLIIDALAYNNSTTLQVFSAGNYGPYENTVASVGINSLVVGASANGNEYASSEAFIEPTEFNTYNKVAAFSSVGPSNWTFFHIETDGTQNLYGLLGVRTSVDLVAPGSYIAAPADMNGNGSSVVFGTSYSSPIAAGSAALMVDYANQNFTGLTHSEAVDARVLKAVMMNSCDKNDGWDNGQEIFDMNGRNIIGTGQSLDLKTGAGILNMSNAYTQYTQGQTGIDGTSNGNGFYVQVGMFGWDLGTVSLDDTTPDYYNDLNNFYVFENLTASYNLTATLSWYRATEQYMDDAGAFYVGNDLYEADLDLGVYSRNSELGTWNLIAISGSAFNLTEHLDFTFDADGDYAIAVLYEGNSFNNTAFSAFREDYALVWNLIEVPEPLALSFFVFGGVVLIRKRRN